MIKMKEYKTESDIGSLLFGTEECGFTVFNRFGDCTNTVLVFNNEAEYHEYVENKYGSTAALKLFYFSERIDGRFNLYNYDCAERTSENIICQFDGKYFVYVRCQEWEYPTIAIVKQN